MMTAHISGVRPYAFVRSGSAPCVSSTRATVSLTVNPHAAVSAVYTAAEGKAFYDEHVEPLLDDAWLLLAERHPKAAAEMLAAVPEEYRLKPEVGFTKVTVAVDNPTPLHYDDGNFGATFLASFEIDSDGALVGGSHVLCCNEEEQVVIVGDCAEGVVFLGDYRRVLHSNAARRGGRRFVVTAYCSKSLKELAARNRAKK